MFSALSKSWLFELTFLLQPCRRIDLHQAKVPGGGGELMKIITDARRANDRDLTSRLAQSAA
jgi:hypothetical protein